LPALPRTKCQLSFLPEGVIVGFEILYGLLMHKNGSPFPPHYAIFGQKKGKIFKSCYIVLKFWV
jgi:hypothetical protein